MAMNTAQTFLYHNTGTIAVPVWAKLVDIMNYPDLGSTPTKIDTTDLSQAVYKTNILGLQEVPDLTFECLYDDTIYDAIALLTDEEQFQIWFGANGVDGKFTWSGDIRVYAMGGGVDEVRKMQVTISASTAIVKS